MEDNKETVDTLSKYGSGFQLKVIAALMTSRDFLHQSLDVLDSKFFDTDAGQWIVKSMIEYVGKYKSLPTNDVFRVQLDKCDDDILKLAVREQLKRVAENSASNDLEYVKSEFLDFAKNQAIRSAILTSADLLRDAKYSEIKNVIDRAMKAGQPRNVGHNWKKDVEVRLSGETRLPVSTGWDVIDNLTGGGLAAGELGVVVAGPGIGKSWTLATIGANAARVGKRVVHYTLELNENYVGLRYDTIFTSISPSSVPNHPDEIKHAVDSIPGDIIIKYFPTSYMTVHNISSHVDQLISLGLAPDLLIVDYADIMRPARRADNRYQELSVIYEELRGVCGELGIPCWTASQAQRAASQDDVIQGDRISESYTKIMISDFIVSLSRKLEDKVANTARAHIIKNRFGPDGLTFPMYLNTNTGTVQIYDETSTHGALLKRQMQSSEGVLKKELAQKFAALQAGSKNE